jgi:hypothetical protein
MERIETRVHNADNLHGEFYKSNFRLKYIKPSDSKLNDISKLRGSNYLKKERFLSLHSN